jgi:hypothetical protein
MKVSSRLSTQQKVAVNQELNGSTNMLRSIDPRSLPCTFAAFREAHAKVCESDVITHDVHRKRQLPFTKTPSMRIIAYPEHVEVQWEGIVYSAFSTSMLHYIVLLHTVFPPSKTIYILRSRLE